MSHLDSVLAIERKEKCEQHCQDCIPVECILTCVTLRKCPSISCLLPLRQRHSGERNIGVIHYRTKETAGSGQALIIKLMSTLALWIMFGPVCRIYGIWQCSHRRRGPAAWSSFQGNKNTIISFEVIIYWYSRSPLCGLQSVVGALGSPCPAFYLCSTRWNQSQNGIQHVGASKDLSACQLRWLTDSQCISHPTYFVSLICMNLWFSGSLVDVWGTCIGLGQAED